jgi:hypothetical protein
MREEKGAYLGRSGVVIIICELGGGEVARLVVLRVVYELPKVRLNRLNRPFRSAIGLRVLGR